MDAPPNSSLDNIGVYNTDHQKLQHRASVRAHVPPPQLQANCRRSLWRFRNGHSFAIHVICDPNELLSIAICDRSNRCVQEPRANHRVDRCF